MVELGVVDLYIDIIKDMHDGVVTNIDGVVVKCQNFW